MQNVLSSKFDVSTTVTQLLRSCDVTTATLNHVLKVTSSWCSWKIILVRKTSVKRYLTDVVATCHAMARLQLCPRRLSGLPTLGPYMKLSGRHYSSWTWKRRCSDVASQSGVIIEFVIKVFERWDVKRRQGNFHMGPI